MKKNQLPFDIRKSYNHAVEIYQAIRNWEEFEIISAEEFIENVRSINDKYAKINENDGEEVSCKTCVMYKNYQVECSHCISYSNWRVGN
jgi:hypothetical protein